MGGIPCPCARMADSLLELLMEETKRLIREKEYAVHAVAGALLEHGELIGDELEDVFRPGRCEHADQARPFQRKVITLPRVLPGQPGDAAATGPAIRTGRRSAPTRSRCRRRRVPTSHGTGAPNRADTRVA